MLDTIFQSFPILKSYIYTNNDSDELYEKTLLGQSRMYLEQRSNFHEKLFLSWDVMSIFINIYSQYNNTDNVAVIPPYISACAMKLKEQKMKMKKLKLQLNNTTNKEEKEQLNKDIIALRSKNQNLHKIILAAIPKSVRD